MRRLAWMCVVCLTLVAPLWAHPGHGSTDPATVTHQMTEPVHILPWVILAAVMGTCSWAWSRRKSDS
jgi:hypothetical protein